jgi:hypothetical protein
MPDFQKKVKKWRNIFVLAQNAPKTARFKASLAHLRHKMCV